MRDEKSKNKIRKMLKVTKSANKSVLEDAKDCDNTAVSLGGTDGDDYGYVSNEANAFYQKYIEKVKDVHEDKGFAPSRPQSLRDLSGTKERVKAAITREREEAKTHTRQRISHAGPKSESVVSRAYNTSSSKTLYDPEAERREEERKKQEANSQKAKAKAKRPPQPPPMDFQALLRLAEKKQHEPVTIAPPERKKEPERLLSAREKREQEERQRWKEQRAQRDRQRETEAKTKDQQRKEPNASGSAAANQTRMEPNGRIPKLNKTPVAATTAAAAASTASKSSTTSDSLKRPAAPTAPSAGQGSSSAKISASTKPTNGSSSSSSSGATSKRPLGGSSSSTSASSTKPTASSAKPAAAASTTTVQSRNPYAHLNKSGATREFPPREFPPRDFPPRDTTKTRTQLEVQRSRQQPVERGRSAPPRRQPEPGNKSK